MEWRREEVLWEAEPAHVKRILGYVEIKDGNTFSVLAVQLQDEDGDDDEFPGLDLTKHRSVCPKFVPQHRPDIKCSIQDLGHDMVRPVQRSTRCLKALLCVVENIMLELGDERVCVTVMIDSERKNSSVCLMWRGFA